MVYCDPYYHFISLDEVQPLLAPNVDVLIIGTGWQEEAAVDPTIREADGVDVRILPTPGACRTFNKLVGQGRRAVLLAHTTC